MSVENMATTQGLQETNIMTSAEIPGQSAFQSRKDFDLECLEKRLSILSLRNLAKEKGMCLNDKKTHKRSYGATPFSSFDSSTTAINSTSSTSTRPSSSRGPMSPYTTATPSTRHQIGNIALTLSSSNESLSKRFQYLEEEEEARTKEIDSLTAEYEFLRKSIDDWEILYTTIDVDASPEECVKSVEDEQVETDIEEAKKLVRLACESSFAAPMNGYQDIQEDAQTTLDREMLSDDFLSDVNSWLTGMETDREYASLEADLDAGNTLPELDLGPSFNYETIAETEKYERSELNFGYALVLPELDLGMRFNEESVFEGKFGYEIDCPFVLRLDEF